MGKCENCRLRKESAKAFDIHWHGEEDCPYEHCPVPDFPKTNADRIRAMTDEELVGLLAHCCPPTFRYEIGHLCKGTLYNADCEGCWLEWLKQEAEEGE